MDQFFSNNNDYQNNYPPNYGSFDPNKRAQEVDFFLGVNKKLFPEDKIFQIREALMRVDQSRFDNIKLMEFKDTLTTLLLSLFLGAFGVDRFYLGDVGLGLLKLFLLTWITCGIFPLVDIFLCFKKGKEINYNKIMSMIL